MPTPFNHLRAAQRLLNDSQVLPAHRALLTAERSPFLLGSIAADARVNSGLKRTDTHFYRYDEPMMDHPWRVMLNQYPTLARAQDAAHSAFVAGYVAHLAMDEYWTKHMLGAQFIERDWGPDRQFRAFMLHILLTYMDERDYALLESWQAHTLLAAQPADWLPFMTDDDLCAWRDFIAGQIVGESQTLAIFGARVQRTAEEFRAVLDSPERMQADLWAYIPRDLLAQVEQQMYDFARDQMAVYLAEICGI